MNVPYFCQLNESGASPSQTYFKLDNYPAGDTVTISRNGNELVVASNNNIKIYDIDKAGQHISTQPVYSYIPDSGKEIISETVAINDGDCLDFKVRPKRSYDTGTLAFISDDGRRKLQDGELYLLKDCHWELAEGFDVPWRSVPLGHSNDLQYFSFFFDPRVIAVPSITLYKYSINGMDYIVEERANIRWDLNNFYSAASNEGKLLRWSW